MKEVLSKNEYDFLEKLLWDNRQILERVCKKTLGITFAYLAEDCVSETYVVACSNTKKLLMHNNPVGWLINVAKYVCLNNMRKERKNHDTVSTDDIQEVEANEDDYENMIFELWISSGAKEKLIEKLSPREKEIYKYVYEDNRSANDIAKELNIAASTVRNTKKSIVDKISADIFNYNF